MKRIYLLLLTTGSFLLADAQSPQSTPANFTTANPVVLTPSGLQSINFQTFDPDSLQGFDEQAARQVLIGKGLSARETFGHINTLKREYIRQKYNLTTYIPVSSSKFTGGSVINASPCVNEGFESTSPGTYNTANGVSGWTLSSHVYASCITPSTSWSNGSSQFAIVATPVFSVPTLGTLPHSPLGGTVVARLNDYTPNNGCTRLAQSFPVTSANKNFRYAYAGVWDDGGSGHSCCEQPGFSVVVKDCSGTLLTCYTHSNTPASSTCSTGITTYSSTQGSFWTSWQIKSIDLTPYIGSCVTIEAIAFDCAFGGHKGFTFFDAECGNSLQQLPCWNCPVLQQPNPVNFCVGGPAQITAPSGYVSYLWTAPGGATISTQTSPVLTVTNPIVSSVYTVNLVSSAGCQFVTTYSLAYTNVGIAALGATGTCSLGAAGSATVVGTGSGSGYIYMWTNSSNSVVSSASVASNLTAGIYSVYITSANNGFCGSATGTVAVTNTYVNVSFLQKPYCGSMAFLNTPQGSNHQWYSNNTPISGTVGTAPTMTVYSPSPGAIYRVRYTSLQGCRDSIVYSLQSSPAPSVSVTYNQLTCQGSNNGVAAFLLSPTPYPIPGMNSYTVFSTGQTSSYVSTLNLSSSNAYTATGLAGAGTYSILAFDGSCYASTSFSVNTFYTANLYSLSIIGSTALCQGGTMPVGVAFTNTNTVYNSYTYTWSPNQFLAGNQPHLQSTLITPTTAPGTSATLIYTVAISPTTAVCAITKTVALTISNPGTPIITSPGLLCNNATTIAVQASPSGGTFLNGGQTGAISQSGILNPSLANLGPNTFTYALTINNCVGQAVSSYTVINAPILSVSGNNTICAGATTTLSATGALSYFWPGLGNSANVVVSPTTTASYVVVGSSGNSCTDSKMITVHVTPQPALNVSGNLSVCIGDSAVLTASGAQSYAWSTGGTAAMEVLLPQASGTNTLSGTNNPGNCSNSIVFTVTVNPVPNIVVTGPGTVCAGDGVVLNASGASTYLWNNIPGPASHTTTILSTGVIMVTGLNQFGCQHNVQHLMVADECAGITEKGLPGGLRIYPNPAHDLLHMAVPRDGRLSIYDAAGKLIHTEEITIGQHTVDVSAYSSGLYLLQYSTATQSQVVRLIKED